MKSVISYVYFKSPQADYNLKYFITSELTYKENIDYIFVINGFDCGDIIFPDFVTVLRRENVGFDFGGHKHALEYITNNNKSYDYFFFMNSGVFGPILPHYYTYEHWSNIFIRKINEKVKLVGTTIACLPHTDLGGYGPKVEGFFFMTDNIGLDLLKNVGSIFYDHPDFVSDIINGEYGLSNCILKNGYSIDCMIRKYQGIDWQNPQNWEMNDKKHPTRKNSFYGESLNPYELIFHKWLWKDSDLVQFDIVRQIEQNNT
uniref:Glycosyltransferase n=1 Tax=viral metagenome TaxID=1070528 RepID=A0A6C0LBB2_9ZZZZ